MNIICWYLVSIIRWYYREPGWSRSAHSVSVEEVDLSLKNVSDCPSSHRDEITYQRWNSHNQSSKCLNGALVSLSRGVVLGLVHLVANGGDGARGTVGNGVVAGNVALGLLLVGLLGSLGGLALDGLRDVVGGVLDRVDGLADDAVVGVVGVRSRHFEVWLVGFEVEV
jgi:hypothetical protein